MSRELREVLGRRVREDDALAGEACEADVRQRGQRLAAVAHSLDRAQRCLQAEPVIRADRRDVEIDEGARGILRGHAAQRLGVLVERQQADDRKRRDPPYGRDRDKQLVEVVEGLDHEEVDAAALEQPRLLGEHRLAILDRAAQRPDRARDEHLGAGHLPRVACDLHAGSVDCREIVLEIVLGELAAVRAEGVRLDDLRAGADEVEVERQHALRRANVRLLGTAQPRDGARDERPHPAVSDEGRSF